MGVALLHTERAINKRNCYLFAQVYAVSPLLVHGEFIGKTAYPF
jgi:hypothetical protein